MNKLSIFIVSLIFTLSNSSILMAKSSESGKTLIWAGCGITKKAFMLELSKAYEKKTGIKVVLNGGGATKGIREAAAGRINIGGACRVSLPRHPDERDAYQVPVAWDALVVIVNKNNPVESITMRQLRDVYLGKITNWRELGGQNKAIELYSRKSKMSGVGRTLRELVFANFDQKFKNVKYRVKSSGPLEKGIVKNIQGIGTTGISSAKKRDVKILRLNGIEPSYANIKNGSYLIYRPLYLVKKIGSTDPMVSDFIKFALSNEGKKVIRSAGTVPYSDALVLVMKQIQQYKQASSAGLYK
ncbi:Phosphate ABC transporter, periplasmic phosphate-binding protein PstS (TC 3.A.1.7.1) [hydrothermal vent metagenome]|uniref:Phosphate ABC transporter, periplasmic phosphate-binding protein PstS (TC 3.A.1.7.1) n=1 Tax=hydrothermal vent metagenome TaxID=652676 RepID=A0A3B1A9W0_9ZZZZ